MSPRNGSLGVAGGKHGTSTRGWWLSLARGLVALFLAGALLVAGDNQSRLATFIAVYWLFGAALTLRWALGSQETAARRLGVLPAVIGTLAAVAILARQPINNAVGTAVLLDIVGVGALAIGFLRILGAFRDDALVDERPRSRNRIVPGALDACLGISLILTSDATSPVDPVPSIGMGTRRGNAPCHRRTPSAAERAETS